MARIDWNIHARAHACMKCAKEFSAGEICRSAVSPFETVLVKTVFAERLEEERLAAEAGEKTKPHPEYVRLDFCDECWKSVSKGDVISAWKSAYVPPETADVDPLKKASPETLLRSLLEGEEPENHLPAIYMLSVILERKRILVERAVRVSPSGRPVHVYEHRKSGDILLIEDPGFEREQIPEVQAEIERLLGMRPAAPENAEEKSGPQDGATPETTENDRSNLKEET